MNFFSKRKNLRRMSKKLNAKDTLQRLEVGCRLYKWCDDTCKWKLHNFKLKKGQSEHEYYLGYKSKLKQRATFILRDTKIFLQHRRTKLPANKTFMFGFTLKTKKRKYDFVFFDQGEWNLLIPYLLQGCEEFSPKDLTGLLPPEFVKNFQKNEPHVLQPIPELQENAIAESQNDIQRKNNKDAHPQISQMQNYNYSKRDNSISSNLNNGISSNQRSDSGPIYTNNVNVHHNNINSVKDTYQDRSRSLDRYYEDKHQIQKMNGNLSDHSTNFHSNLTSTVPPKSWKDIREDKRDNRFGSKRDAYPGLNNSAHSGLRNDVHHPGLRNDVHRELMGNILSESNNIYPDLRKNTHT